MPVPIYFLNNDKYIIGTESRNQFAIMNITDELVLNIQKATDFSQCQSSNNCTFLN